MNRKKAIDLLDNLIGMVEDKDDSEYDTALKMGKQALTQESEIEENIIKYMKKYPNHVGNTDFWEGFYACRNVVLQLDDEECSPKEQESKSIIREAIEDYVCNYLTDTAKAQEILNALQDMEHEPIECDDAVSREAVLDEIEKWIVIELQYTNAIPRLIKRINELPPVTHKSGKWIKSRDCYGNHHFTCSECGNDIATQYADNWEDKYCSECGARMESNNNE